MLQPIAVDDLVVRPHDLWSRQWLLLTAGDWKAGHFNTMTVGWGMLGTLWGKPVAQVFVRPTRYTYAFMERYESFTLCAFPERYRRALSLLGSRSGRDGDKVAQSGLTPVAATRVAAPAFAEAELVIECRKIYWSDLDPAHFLAPEIADNYPLRDYHRCYVGEIVAVFGTPAYAGVTA
ncbi:MAG: flavin reductase [Anaerolineae bacterium]|nr:flavin reductase [Anaerolineae bacterium]